MANGAYKQPRTLTELDGKLNTSVTVDPDGTVRVRLYRTEIFTYKAEAGIVTLDFGGYPTPTTKRRMKDCFRILDLPFNVGSHKGILTAWNYRTGNSVALSSNGVNVVDVALGFPEVTTD